MSVVLIIGTAAVCEGITETAKTCITKALDYATHIAWKHEQRARRKRRERREFV